LKLEKAQGEIDKSRKRARVRDQLRTSSGIIKSAQSSRDSSTKEQKQLHAEVARLKDAVAAAEEARVTAEKQKNETSAKFAEANKQIAILVQERDQALAQLKGTKETEQRVQALLAENGDLKQKLANAEKTVRNSEEKPKTREDLSRAKRQVAQLQQQLFETQKQNQYFEARVAELRVQLDDASAQLKVPISAEQMPKKRRGSPKKMTAAKYCRARTAGGSATLSGKKLMLAELDRLKIQSML
jgi:chromosome segregation ATPase